MAADLNTIREIAGRVATAQGIEVVDVELRGGGKARTLRITIDKPEGVTHEDCAMISRDVSTILDVEDAVQWRVVHAGSFVAGIGQGAEKAGGLPALYRKPDEVDDARTGEWEQAF